MVKKRSQTKKATLRTILLGLLPYFLPLIFFIIAILTHAQYGMNWDSPVHFARGQAFLRFMLIGKTNYNDLPLFCQNIDGLNKRVDYLTGEVCDKTRKNRVSEYESTLLDFTWAKKVTYGHPPLSDIMLAASNQVFFKWLGWFEDIEAYNLFPLFMTFVLLIVVAYWANITYGKFASLIAVLSIALFPLLFGEQHFNVKDPPIAAFFTLGIFFFWLGITRKKARHLILSALFGGMSFATKINYTFAPIILLPWIILYTFPAYYSLIKKKPALLREKFFSTLLKLFPPRVILALILYPVVIALVFFLTWPAMWFDTVQGLTKFIAFYSDIGVKSCPYTRFSSQWFISCSDFLSITYFFYTVPIQTLVLVAVGVIAAVKKRKEHSMVTILWLSFFFLTFLRVTLSVSSIYGGLRQVLEFVGPMGLLAGLGGVALRDRLVMLFRNYTNFSTRILVTFLSVLLVGLYLPIVFTLIKLHPNQNLYFNALVGGLSGAAEKNFPGYGNSYGNANLQGVKWLNVHAVKNGNLALVFGLGQNISRASLRNDISYSNAYRSGYHMDGEYQLVLILQGDPQVDKFSYQYLDRFFTPVYVDSIEGVPILKIWKNEKRYLKKGVSFAEKEETTGVRQNEDYGFLIILPVERTLKRLEFTYSPICEIPVKSATISIGTKKDSLHQLFLSPQNFTQKEVRDYKGGSVFLFAGDQASFIRVQLPDSSSCDVGGVSFKLFVFGKNK
ncbi:MAG: hypothetical protein Q8Q49_00490 [bacterium]|nr:hypothetical protein [bacterium]